ncbi:MAG: hypothetical protein ACRC2I_09825, partial [Plesiomonas shigelloides]
MSMLARYFGLLPALLLGSAPLWAAVTPAEQVTQFIQQDVTSFAKAQKSQQFDVKLRNMPDFP